MATVATGPGTHSFKNPQSKFILRFLAFLIAYEIFNKIQYSGIVLFSVPLLVPCEFLMRPVK
jgi:hypothetical protein